MYRVRYEIYFELCRGVEVAKLRNEKDFTLVLDVHVDLEGR